MGKVFTIKLDGLEWEALTWLMGKELVRQEREHYTHFERQLETVLSKLISAAPPSVDWSDMDLLLPKRIAKEMLRVIADPEVITAKSAQVKQLQQEVARLTKELKGKAKSKPSVKAKTPLRPAAALPVKEPGTQVLPAAAGTAV